MVSVAPRRGCGSRSGVENPFSDHNKGSLRSCSVSSYLGHHHPKRLVPFHQTTRSFRRGLGRSFDHKGLNSWEKDTSQISIRQAFFKGLKIAQRGDEPLTLIVLTLHLIKVC